LPAWPLPRASECSERADIPGESAKGDREKLQGRWKALTYEEGGKEDPDKAKGLVFAFAADTFSFPFLDTTVTGRLKLRASASQVVHLAESGLKRSRGRG